MKSSKLLKKMMILNLSQILNYQQSYIF